MIISFTLIRGGRKVKHLFCKLSINLNAFLSWAHKSQSKDFWSKFLLIIRSHKEMNYSSALVLVMAIIGLRPSRGAPPTSLSKRFDCKTEYDDSNMITLGTRVCTKSCKNYYPEYECPEGRIKSMCICPDGMVIQYMPMGWRMKCVEPKNCIKWESVFPKLTTSSSTLWISLIYLPEKYNE